LTLCTVVPFKRYLGRLTSSSGEWQRKIFASSVLGSPGSQFQPFLPPNSLKNMPIRRNSQKSTITLKTLFFPLCPPSPCHHPLTPLPHTALAPTSPPPPPPPPFTLINIAYLSNLSKRKNVVIMIFLKFFEH
jgi:hypothetical protein